MVALTQQDIININAALSKDQRLELIPIQKTGDVKVLVIERKELK